MQSIDCIDGICRTVLDGIKDSEMQIDWAEAARERGNTELAQLHLEEAKKRLSGAKEWYERGMRLYEPSGGGKLDPLTKALIDREKEHYREILDKTINFKAGA